MRYRPTALLFLALLLPTLTLAQEVEVGSFPGTPQSKQVFSSVTVKAANDTSAWIPVGYFHFFNLFVDLDPGSGTYFASADSLPNFEIRYELWYGGVNEDPGTTAQPFWEKNQSQAIALVTFSSAADTANGGRWYADFHKVSSTSVSPTAWIRFIVVPGTTNDRSTGYKLSAWLLRQP